MLGAQEKATAVGTSGERGYGYLLSTGPARRSAVLLGVRGLLAVVFGVLVLAWPAITVLALALVFAVYVLADGIGLITTGVGAHGSRRWSSVVAGVVAVVAGLAAALWPGVTVLVLVLWVGAWAVVTGVSELVAAVRGEGSGRWLMALAGFLSIVAGLVVLVWPGIGALAVATVLGIYALVAGVALLWAAWQVRRAAAVTVGL